MDTQSWLTRVEQDSDQADEQGVQSCVLQGLVAPVEFPVVNSLGTQTELD